MIELLIVIPPCGFKAWLDRFDDQFESIQLGRQRGVMVDGTRFRYIVAESDWLEQLRGIRLKSFKIEEGCNLKTHEIAALQAMCND